MAIVVDAARDAYDEWGNFKSPPYTKGNDHPDTPNPTWQNMNAMLASVAETHIVQKSQNTPTDNTGDTHVPIMVTNTWLPSVPATVRPA